MTAAIAGSATFGAAVLLWILAQHAARSRDIVLGRIPARTILLAALVGASAASVAPCCPATAVVIGGVAVAAVVDLRTGLIFDPLTLALAMACLAIGLIDAHPLQAVVGGASVSGALYALYRLTGRRGIGLGDVKLAGGIGAGLGVSTGFAAMALAFVFGGVYGTGLLVTHRASRTARIAFGPFVAAGTYAALFFWGSGR